MKCSSDLSWEERLFAECIWPPRSYSCSFCDREFRSAQALGGHMNVHRRDRAKLKQVQSLDDHSRVPSSTPKRPLGDAISGSDDDVNDDYDRVETKLSVGLSSVLFRNRPTVTCNKRPKVLQCQVLELEPASSMGNLDLELRLGVL